MGPIWPWRPQVGPMLAPWNLLSGIWKLKVITWINVDFSLVRFPGSPLRAILWPVPKLLYIVSYYKIVLVKWLPLFPGVKVWFVISNIVVINVLHFFSDILVMPYKCHTSISNQSPAIRLFLQKIVRANSIGDIKAFYFSWLSMICSAFWLIRCHYPFKMMDKILQNLPVLWV